MTWPRADYDRAMKLVARGLNDCEISRRTRIPRGTVRDWRRGKVRKENGDPKTTSSSRCPRCDGLSLDEKAYAYLLGLYLGDGCISEEKRRVFKLRVVLDKRYPIIISECAEAIRLVTHKQAVSFINKIGCIEVASYWKHWPCIFPQHGAGPKHLREICLKPWQKYITTRHASNFLRGLIHSDGSRGMNRVKSKAGKWYEYPRYEFTNHSKDIRHLFCLACDAFGVRWTRTNWKTIAISRRPDVARLDEVIGPKS